MTKILIKESELIKLIETAMDLDIYNQPMTTAADNGNMDIEDAVEDIISKMEELLSMLKGGKQIHSELKSRIYKHLDGINNVFSNIKYGD
jgi:predicted nucleotide-binding protein (sugar kinase/HSP70/actin superfamily)